MRISRIYVAETLEVNQHIQLSEKTSHYLLKVLRLKTGTQLILFNGDGYEFDAELIEAQRKTATVSILKQSVKEPQPSLDIHLGIGLSKGDRMEQVIQKATELGVGTISLLITDFTAYKLQDHQLEKKMHHWQGILQSACEQSHRCYLPTLHSPVTVENWLAKLGKGLKLVLSPGASESMSALAPEKKLFLLIGPEGGLSEEEITGAKNRGFAEVHLGRHILRTETAPLAAIAAAQVLWGDFR